MEGAGNPSRLPLQGTWSSVAPNTITKSNENGKRFVTAIAPARRADASETAVTPTRNWV